MGALYDEPVVFVDLETTGASPAAARIIEVGLVAATGGRLEREWSTLVNPGAPIPRTIQHFTGSTDEMAPRRAASIGSRLRGSLARCSPRLARYAR